MSKLTILMLSFSRVCNDMNIRIVRYVCLRCTNMVFCKTNVIHVKHSQKQESFDIVQKKKKKRALAARLPRYQSE